MIYLVEDDDNIRKLVSYALSREGYEVRGFAEPTAFWQAIAAETPALVMLDIMLPGEDGLSILKKLRASSRTADIGVIMLTAKGSEYDKVTGLDAGADDYIAKPFGMTELISRVRAFLRRAEKAPAKVFHIGPLVIDTARYTVTVSGKEISLSFKEFALLAALADAEGKVVTREALLGKVWGEFYEESRTLDVHIRKLRIKLGDAAPLIQTVKNVGYKLGGEKIDA